MAQFSYTAQNSSGAAVSGAIEAASRESALELLRNQHLKPISLSEASEQKGFNISIGKPKVKSKDLVIFTRQISTMISAGVPILRSLNTLANQSDSKALREVLTSISKDVQSGQSLGDAFAKHPNVFSDVYVNMVRAGEAGGILDDIMQRLALQQEKSDSIKKKVKSAMTYPVVILTITVIAFFGVMLFIIPKIGKILKDLAGDKAELPVYTKAMLSMSAFMQHNAIFILVIGFGGIYFIRRYIKTPTGKYKFHALLLRTPVIKTLITKVAIARFARTFASLMSSGVAVLDALEVTGGAIGNKVIEAELKEAAKAVRNGKQLSEPISESPHFPPIVAQMLAIGEETGQVDTILIKVADFYEEDVETTIDGLSSLIEPLMIIVLGAMVGLIAASVMGPIANLSKNIGG